MQSVVRAASLGQLARATVAAVPPAGAALTKPIPPADGLPLVQAPGNFFSASYERTAQFSFGDLNLVFFLTDFVLTS
jgi:hypothetical protein